MAMQPRGLLLSRGHRESDVSERQPGWQLQSEKERQGREERARRMPCKREAHCSGKGGSQQLKVESNAIWITPEQGGGKATGRQECPRKLGTANSLVRRRLAPAALRLLVAGGSGVAQAPLAYQFPDWNADGRSWEPLEVGMSGT